MFEAGWTDVPPSLLAKLTVAFWPLPSTHNTWKIEVPFAGCKIKGHTWFDPSRATLGLHISRYVRLPPERYYSPADAGRAWRVPVHHDDKWDLGSWSYSEPSGAENCGFTMHDSHSKTNLLAAIKWAIKHADKAVMIGHPSSRIDGWDGKHRHEAPTLVKGHQLGLF